MIDPFLIAAGLLNSNDCRRLCLCQYLLTLSLRRLLVIRNSYYSACMGILRDLVYGAIHLDTCSGQNLLCCRNKLFLAE